MELTDKQREFYEYLKRCRQDAGNLPSLRRAAGELGVSHTAVAQLLAQLEKKGMVRREGRYSRTIRLLPGAAVRSSGSAGREVPVLGRITAGLPIAAQQEWDGSVVVDGDLFGGDELFCLRVSGASMRDAGILDGDLVICEPRHYAEQGEIVVALIHHEEATVKRFFRRADTIELRPENPDYPVQHYGLAEVLVQGRVVGVVRGMHPIFSRAG